MYHTSFRIVWQVLEYKKLDCALAVKVDILTLLLPFCNAGTNIEEFSPIDQ